MDDDTLLESLAAAWADIDELAADIAVQGRGVFTWRTIDDDLALAVLTHDSARATVAMRSGPQAEPRVLVFTGEGLSVEVEIGVDQLVGQLVPPGPGRVQVEHPAGATSSVEVDEYGFFVLAMPRPVGSTQQPALRLRCETGTASLRTDWISL